jgi:hypothetical protein
MTLTPEEITAIDIENDRFFNELNVWLDNRLGTAEHPRFCPIIKFLIRYKFILEADTVLSGINPKDTGREEIIKNGMEPIIFHRPPTIDKAYSYYAQREYNIYLRLGYVLLHFYNHQNVQPTAKRVNGVDYVARPSKKGVSLIEYFKDCKQRDHRQFDSIIGRDFLEGKVNFLDKSNLIEYAGYDLPIEFLYYSYYIAWEPKHALFINPDPVKIGFDFLWSILTKKMNYMFNKETEYYSERTEEYLKSINEVLTGNPCTFPELLNSETSYGLIDRILPLYYYCRGTNLHQKEPYIIRVNVKYSFLDIVEGDARLRPEHQIFIVERDDKGMSLFFKVAFKSDKNYRDQLLDYLDKNSFQFRKDLFEYDYSYPEKTEFRKLYDKFSVIGLNTTEFTEVIRKILDNVLTEYLIYCGRKELIRIYSEYFNGTSFFDKGFLKYIKSVINKSFRNFEKKMASLATGAVYTGIDSDLRKRYHDILVKNRNPGFMKPPVASNVPPFIDEVDLREKIDKIAAKSFGLLRKEFLMSFPYRNDKLVVGRLYEKYCQKKIGLPHNVLVEEEFYNKIKNISFDIVNFYNDSQEVMK